MRRVAGPLAGVVLAGVLAVAPAARAGQGELTLSGARTASVTVRLRTAVTLDLAKLVPDPTAAWSGVVVRDAHGALLDLAVQVHAWTGAPHPPAPVHTRLAALRLPAGTYRLELLASGPASVRVPATGAGVMQLHADGGSSDRVTIADVRTDGLPLANYVQPVTLSRSGAVVLVFFERATAHQASVPQLCFAAPGAATCAQSYGFSSVQASPGSVGDGWQETFSAIYGSDGVDGLYDAKVQDVTVDAPRAMEALLVQV